MEKICFLKLLLILPIHILASKPDTLFVTNMQYKSQSFPFTHHNSISSFVHLTPQKILKITLFKNYSIQKFMLSLQQKRCLRDFIMVNHNIYRFLSFCLKTDSFSSEKSRSFATEIDDTQNKIFQIAVVCHYRSRPNIKYLGQQWSFVKEIDRRQCKFIYAWNYNRKRNVYSGFSIVTMRRAAINFFCVGSCKNLHLGILITRHFMIVALFKVVVGCNSFIY